ncbi:Nucleoside diphosphate kinase [compost metagenome]
MARLVEFNLKGAGFEVDRAGTAGEGLAKLKASPPDVVVLEVVEAAEGTVRKLYADNKGENIVHGSDSPENGAIEIAYFFPARELADLGQD